MPTTAMRWTNSPRSCRHCGPVRTSWSATGSKAASHLERCQSCTDGSVIGSCDPSVGACGGLTHHTPCPAYGSCCLKAGLLGLDKVVVEDVEFDEVEQVLVVSARPRKATKRRCGRCGKRCPGYDQGEGRRRWRTLDFGQVRAFLEADSPRVRCAEHGVIAAQVPWARHGAGHTYAFDDTAAWLVTHCSKSAVRDLLRIAWRTVGSIVTRVVADAEATTDRFANLRRIGIDEISYKRGHKYLMVTWN